MRILTVMPGLDGAGGAERSFGAVAPRMIRRGVRLDVALLDGRVTQVPTLSDEGVAVHDLSAGGGRFRRLARLLRLVCDLRPDVIHATLWDATFFSQVAGLLTRTPVIVTWASVGSEAEHTGSVTWKHHVLRMLDIVLARVCRTDFHAVTQGVADANSVQLGVDRCRVFVVERGRPELPALTKEQRSSVRKSLGVSHDQKVILAVGRSVPVKDHVTLIAAMDALVRHRDDVVLLVAGEGGSALPAEEQAIRRRGLERQVHLLGHRDDIEQILQIADVFVSSSLSEGAAGAVIEAFSVGLPVVSTDVLGLRGILADEHNAVVSPIGSVNALAESINRVLDDDQLAVQIGAGGRATYEQRFSLDRAADGMIDMYESVIARSRRRS